MLGPIITDVKRFILIQNCPKEWELYDLYLILGRGVYFYIGQSFSAFYRVQEHFLRGYKAKSDVGRFILCNWPLSMRFIIELRTSKSEEFAHLRQNLAEAERELILTYRPCFNFVLNDMPTKLPETYKPIGELMQYGYSLRKLQYQARQAIRKEEKQKWLET